MNEEKSPFRLPVFVFFITFFTLALRRIITTEAETAGKEVAKMMEYLPDIIIGIISTAVTAALSYYAFLRKMPDKITKSVTENLQAKLTPSNDVLKSDHTHINDKLENTNQYLQNECRDMRKGIDSLVAREKLDEMRYERLNYSQRDIVDAIRRMDSLANQMMLLVEKNAALSQENKMLKDELQKSRQQKRYAEHQLSDYEFEL